MRKLIFLFMALAFVFPGMSRGQNPPREPLIPKARIESAFRYFQGTHLISISTLNGFFGLRAEMQSMERNPLPPFLPLHLLEAGGISPQSVKFIGHAHLSLGGEVVFLIGDFDAKAFLAKYPASSGFYQTKYKTVDVPIPSEYQRGASTDLDAVSTLNAFVNDEGMLVFVEPQRFAQFNNSRQFREPKWERDWLPLTSFVDSETEIVVFGYQEMRKFGDWDTVRERVPLIQCFQLCAKQLVLEEFILGPNERVAKKIAKWKIERLTTNADLADDSSSADRLECLGRVKQGERFAVSREGRLVRVSITPGLYKVLTIGPEH